MISSAEDGDADGVHPDVQPDLEQRDEEDTFDRTVEEGRQRLGRSWVQLLTTGFLGGFDVGVGVLALLLVQQLTHDPLLSGLAFSAGFIALTLARSELFTENFLVPVTAVVAKEGTPRALARLWGTTLVTNLVAGWLLAALLMAAFPSLRDTAIETAGHYVELGITWHAFALAIVGGLLITVMTYLQHATESDGVRLVPAVIIGTVVSIGHVNHAIVASLTCFAALVAGAPFGYADWAGMAALAIVGNMIGGLGLVTVLRLLQVPHKVIEAREGD
ncbi:formate/nitrite transporter family protein [Mycolicibacterium sp.]|uniref:formate/nitrite transporter family protein n=1 Tax=Mycolicibacterium sp. TaxID=2320850 RepID=UPI0025DE8D4A|nr:formate/nitrite transporter family protein [Mycolicibacterium sp.]